MGVALWGTVPSLVFQGRKGKKKKQQGRQISASGPRFTFSSQNKEKQARFQLQKKRERIKAQKIKRQIQRPMARYRGLEWRHRRSATGHLPGQQVLFFFFFFSRFPEFEPWHPQKALNHCLPLHPYHSRYCSTVLLMHTVLFYSPRCFRLGSFFPPSPSLQRSRLFGCRYLPLSDAVSEGQAPRPLVACLPVHIQLAGAPPSRHTSEEEDGGETLRLRSSHTR